MLALLLSLVALVSPAGALARADEPPVSTYRSPSGAWRLSVTRTEQRWNGPVELVLAHDDVEAWRATHELGLRDAVVDDEGHVAGYGYTGMDEVVYPGPYLLSGRPFGMRIRVFAFAPGGEQLLDLFEERGPSPGVHGQPVPVVAGLFLQPELGRFVLRMQDEDFEAEEWITRDLASGKELERFRPKFRLGLEAPVRSLLDARPVPGTTLVVLNGLGTRETRRTGSSSSSSIPTGRSSGSSSGHTTSSRSRGTIGPGSWRRARSSGRGASTSSSASWPRRNA